MHMRSKERSDFGLRLWKARDYAGLTQVALAKLVGMSQSSYAEAERGGQGSAYTAQIAKACGVRAEWLATGEGDFIEKSANPMAAAAELYRPGNTEPGPGVRGIVPLISWVQAGAWAEAQDSYPLGDGEQWMACMVPHSDGTFALRVKGDSMTAAHGNSRTYPEGSYIFVDPEKRMPVNGDRIIAKLAGEQDVTFKVYKNEDGRQWLMPLNPSHEPIRQPFTVLGTIIGKWEDG